MGKLAFNDGGDGYYQVDVPDGHAAPEWTNTLTPCSMQPIESDPKDAIRAQIKAMETEKMMPRATREFMLLFLEASFTPEQLSQNIGYAGVKAFDNQIKVLRDQL